MSKLRKFGFHVVALLIIVGLIVFLAFNQMWMIDRLVSSGYVFGMKFRSVFLFYCGTDEKAPYLLETINDIENYPILFRNFDWESLGESIGQYFRILFSAPNALSWLLDFSDFMMLVTRALMILAMVALVIFCVVSTYFNESHKAWMEKTRSLQRFQRFENGPWATIKRWFAEYWAWWKKGWYFKIAVILVAVLLGLPMVALDLIAEYFYFFTSFDFLALLDTLLGDVATILVGWFTIPKPLRVLILFILFRVLTLWRARRLIEGKLMPANEAMVDNDTGVFTLILGKMRGGKTTLAASMARILNTVYHKNAFENMDRCAMMFPDFPWMPFERDIVRLAGKRRIVNMDQAAAFAMRVYDVGEHKPVALYGYDVGSQRNYFIDGANRINLLEALMIYAESYWVYFHAGNLISSNFPIRTDDLRLDKGHLVLYDSNAFRRKVLDQPKDSSLSHILVFDMLRLGKKKDPCNVYRDCSGPMIAVATEFGKEQGNMVSNTAYSAKDEGANPKNDLLDYSLKLGGHLANIWHTNFFKFIADEQRSGSLTSNLVTVAQSIFTADRANQKEKMALHGFELESAILDALRGFRDWFYKKYRHVREDNTLPFYLINKLGAFCYSIETKIYMRYGYKEVKLPMCTADTSGNLTEGESKKFYIINFIDYASRFESACMKDFLNSRKPKADHGFFDIPTYERLMPTKSEWDMQGSYLVTDLENPELKFSTTPKVTRRRDGSRRRNGADRSSQGSGGGVL